ncbi:class I SAM-dependent methyltransferase [Streptomyces sp. B21-102]|uniref:class I SAM-dependent methyltransferase n=1 Tax=unclassified Streptomyces TaxID=2593676 RepID=UPI002FF36535
MELSGQEPMMDALGETALWTLHHRSLAARDPACGLADPKALELVQTLGHPFTRRFGTDNRGWARGMAVRTLCYDRQVRVFLARHPKGTVVCLGEGLETQFWRVDNGTVQWLGVELAEPAALRRRFLPDTDRRRTVTGSLLDTRWMREVDASAGVLVLAQGVLMYLPWDRVRALVEACATRFPGAGLVFDTPPAWFTADTVQSRFRYPARYRPPPMPWGMTPVRLRELRACPGVAAASQVPVPRGTGLWWGRVVPVVDRVPVLRSYGPLFVTRLLFAPEPAPADPPPPDTREEHW